MPIPLNVTDLTDSGQQVNISGFNFFCLFEDIPLTLTDTPLTLTEPPLINEKSKKKICPLVDSVIFNGLNGFWSTSTLADSKYFVFLLTFR